MCLYPRLLKNKKYTKNNKNGGKIPAVSDERTLLVPVKCGNCLKSMLAGLMQNGIENKLKESGVS